MTDTNLTLIPYEDMLKAGMHFGRKRTVFHPGMKRFVFAVRDGICLIDLLKTQEALKLMVDFLKKTKEGGGLILFVAPTKQSQESVKKLADVMGMPYVLERWIGGSLTNFKIINARVKKLEEMERDRAAGAFDKYTKKERVVLDRDMEKMSRNFEGLKKLTRMPDVVFVSSLHEGALPVREAQRMNVPVAGIANTDANPDNVQFVIPANDRSKRSVDLILEAMTKELS